MYADRLIDEVDAVDSGGTLASLGWSDSAGVWVSGGSVVVWVGVKSKQLERAFTDTSVDRSWIDRGVPAVAKTAHKGSAETRTGERQGVG